jgi:hypothetical protein
MSYRSRNSDEPTYGEMRAIEHLTAAAETMRCVIMHDVSDREARAAALAMISKALGTAVQGVSA